MSDPISIDRWLETQGDIGPHRMHERVTLGPIYSDSWLRDPKHLVFALSRYKFVASMVHGAKDVAEIGAGDAWAGNIVLRHVYSLDYYDIAPLSGNVRCYDIMRGTLPDMPYSALYALDVLEHVADSDVFFRNLAGSLTQHGQLVVGTPSLEGQKYASLPSRRLHVNCMTGEDLRSVALHHFWHVFMFSMNDEVVHTGFMPMAHYLFAVCAEPIRD